jgi:hypothetical protein
MVRKDFSVPPEMAANIRDYCCDNKIESEAELIRCAVAQYLDRSYSDETLKMRGVLRQKIPGVLPGLADTVGLVVHLSSKAGFGLSVEEALTIPEIRAGAARQ